MSRPFVYNGVEFGFTGTGMVHHQHAGALGIHCKQGQLVYPADARVVMRAPLRQFCRRCFGAGLPWILSAKQAAARVKP